MAQVFVGKHSELKDGDRRIVRAGEIEIGVYRHQGRYFAYRNLCHHQGGPACEGRLVGKVIDVIAPDRTYRSQSFDESVPHIVCPWHGYEYRLLTGECSADPKLRLRGHEVVEREDEIYVVF